MHRRQDRPGVPRSDRRQPVLRPLLRRAAVRLVGVARRSHHRRHGRAPPIRERLGRLDRHRRGPRVCREPGAVLPARLVARDGFIRGSVGRARSLQLDPDLRPVCRPRHRSGLHDVGPGRQSGGLRLPGRSDGEGAKDRQGHSTTGDGLHRQRRDPGLLRPGRRPRAFRCLLRCDAARMVPVGGAVRERRRPAGHHLQSGTSGWLEVAEGAFCNTSPDDCSPTRPRSGRPHSGACPASSICTIRPRPT